jgi:hypothetical protein
LLPKLWDCSCPRGIPLRDRDLPGRRGITGRRAVAQASCQPALFHRRHGAGHPADRLAYLEQPGGHGTDRSADEIRLRQVLGLAGRLSPQLHPLVDVGVGVLGHPRQPRERTADPLCGSPSLETHGPRRGLGRQTEIRLGSVRRSLLHASGPTGGRRPTARHLCRGHAVRRLGPSILARGLETAPVPPGQQHQLDRRRSGRRRERPGNPHRTQP